MAGFNLKEGTFDDRDVSEDELWAAISNIFTSKSKNDTSYKYGFLKAILDNLNHVNGELILSFDIIFTRFAEIYWNLVTEYDLRQKAKTKDNRKSAIEKVLQEAKDKYEIGEFQSFDNLPNKIKDDIAYQVKLKCKTYVVGAFFEDTKRLFFSFSKKDEWIKLNPRMYTFVCRRKMEIEKLNTYEWAHFIETINKDYCANYILTDCLRKTKSASVNTLEMLFDAEEAELEAQIYNDFIIQEDQSQIKTSSFSDKIDEEFITMLGDPEKLIKHLRKNIDRNISK